MKPVFLYALHSGNLYGTERMALATLEGTRAQFSPVLFAPPGPALVEARRLGMATEEFRNARDFARRLLPYIVRNRRIAFAATGVMHSLVFWALNLPFRRRNVHLHLVHGGSDEQDSYGRKQKLNRHPVTFVAVSDYARERLVAHGTDPRKIRVLSNFLPLKQIDRAPRRPVFVRDGIRKVAVVSRIDPIKRIDLLLETLEAHPDLGGLEFRIMGTGDLDEIRERAARNHLNVRLEGFCPDVPAALAEADLLLHLCPVEPFGLAILEAMAARLPVLVPDQGGAAALVEPGVSGFHFRADEGESLAACLRDLATTPASRLNAVVDAADARLRDRYSDAAGLEAYRALLAPVLRD